MALRFRSFGLQKLQCCSGRALGGRTGAALGKFQEGRTGVCGLLSTKTATNRCFSR